ncbi:MAG: hypothetical protein GTN38_02640 [Candidatus Aenigmarchaeota archaeon]|nr:hypothetical protein [Candidatus Aenigmarchaeota archaeon]NIP40534.1 hypothetical protein [Candidatus Aenigmarchaeota archaeon]NIQ18379.1 hypothetical protein [Candidatus Aenigmarchaeota archaeon]
MDPKGQWILVFLVILILNVTAVSLSGMTGRMVSGDSRPFSVSEVYEHSLLGDYVYVKGEIIEVSEDHVSDKGFHYQQFVISDGEEEILIFCSVKYGRTEVKEGNQIVFDGEFRKYYNTYEISGFCSEIRKIKV